jgi:hypothetical protein
MTNVPFALRLAAAAVVALAFGQAQGKAVDLPKTHAGRRLGEYLEVIEKGGADRQKAFLKASVADSLIIRRGEPQLLQMLRQLNEREGGFVVTKIEESADTAITVLATSKKTGIAFKLGVRTQTAEPFRIRGVLIDTMGPVERD